MDFMVLQSNTACDKLAAERFCHEFTPSMLKYAFACDEPAPGI